MFAPDLLMVTDLSANQARLEQLLGVIDVERPSSEVIKVVLVKHAAAEEVVDKLNRILTPKGAAKPGAEALAVVADERTNRIILVGLPSLVARAQEVLEQLDLEMPGDSRARVVRLKNADAKELATTLEAMTNGAARKTASPGPSTAGEVKSASMRHRTRYSS